MSEPTSPLGQQLYRILPSVYRERDAGDLASYLDACGQFLDLIRATLDQRLADSFPSNPDAGAACQAWLLPYFAQLLDVRLVSLDESGRREEVASAVAWRQRKGTLACIEQIAEAIAHLEVEVQEGWKRVAVTPRIGMPLTPASALGQTTEPNMALPQAAATHPALPAATVDMRRASRAVRAPGNPAAHLSHFGSAELIPWVQANPHGVPCFPGSFEDVSRRTVDVRTPSWKHGHVHPKRILLFAPPPTGFFYPGQPVITWASRNDPGNAHLFEETTEAGGRVVFRGRTPRPLGIRGTIALDQSKTFRFENLCLLNSLTASAGRLVLRKVAARSIDTQASIARGLALDAADSLLARVRVRHGPTQLECCTVLQQGSFLRLNASDCIFDGKLTVGGRTGCIRYSRIPPQAPVWAAVKRLWHNTADAPIFFHFAFCGSGGVVVGPPKFGQPSCGVLHPATPDSIRFGAEDGGEMGACHHLRHCLRARAVLDKLSEFLPAGTQAALVPDPRLHSTPPQLSTGPG